MPQTAIYVYRRRNGSIPLTEWLDGLEDLEPKAYEACLERILQLEEKGFELRRPITDTLEDGIKELRAKVGRVHYRILYFFCGKNEACLSHGLTKEGKVPNTDIELAKARKQQVEVNRERHLAEWEIDDGEDP